jgi:adenine/guanine phosphoribosyltransferase-like PRPP-binding protein
MNGVRVGAHYLDQAFGDTAALVAGADRALAGTRFDTLAGSGLSGALVIPVLARALGKNILIVRKPGDSHHATSIAEGRLGDSWVFADDLINSGETFHRVKAAIEELGREHGIQPEFRGAYLYGYQPRFLGPGDLARVYGISL